MRIIRCLLSPAACRYLLGLLVLLLGPLLAAAQGAEAVLRGRVLDADTRQPVPNAQVGIGNNRLGTSTNTDGRFALRVPAAYQGSELEVALLGYQRYRQFLPPLPGPELLVYLKISPASLGSVVVAASATGIIREAVRRIPRNYPVRPTQLTGFYRESDEEATSQRYDYLAEGLLHVYKPGYQRAGATGYVQVLQTRQVDLRRAPPGPGPVRRIEWQAGGLVPQRFDFVQQRLEFISERHFKDYQYRFGAQTTFQGRAVYVITFAPRPGSSRANFAGEVYIDERSYAFLGAAWHRTPAGIAREQLLVFEATERAYRTDYQEFAGRYYLKSIWYNTLSKPLQGQVRHHLAEYLTTAIDTGRVVPPPYPERSQYGDIFLRNPVPYDSAFWQGQTTLLPAAPLRRALLDQARERQADSLLRAARLPLQPGPAAGGRPGPGAATRPDSSRVVAGTPPWVPGRPTRVWRLSYGYALGVLPVAGPGGALRVVVAPAGSAFRAAAGGEAPDAAVTLCYSAWYQLSLPGHLAVVARTHTAFGAYRGSGWELGLNWEHNLNPRGRPVRARLGLGYLRQGLAYRLGTFDNPDASLRLAGTSLHDDRLLLSLQALTGALRPSLGLGLELSHRWELVADMSYLASLNTRNQLLVEEKRFFGNEATLDLPASEVQWEVNGQPAPALPWQLGRVQVSLGVMWHPRR